MLGPLFKIPRLSALGVACSTLLSFSDPVPSLAVLRTHDVILFQGDSITDGGRWQSGSDYNHIMGQSYTYIIAGEVGLQYPERNLNFINRGISGNKVTDLASRWTTDTINLKPDLLSILVGINDTLLGETADQYQQGYDKLLGDTVAALPTTKIVLGEPFILPVGRYQDHYQDVLAQVKIRQAIVAKLADKYHLPLIHFQAALDAACQKAPPDHWSWDGVHPTYAGHALMAREWMKTVNTFWPGK